MNAPPPTRSALAHAPLHSARSRNTAAISWSAGWRRGSSSSTPTCMRVRITSSGCRHIATARCRRFCSTRRRRASCAASPWSPWPVHDLGVGHRGRAASRPHGRRRDGPAPAAARRALGGGDGAGVAGRLLSQREPRVVSSCARLWPSRSSAPLSVVSVLFLANAENGGPRLLQLGRLPPAPRPGAHGVRRQQLRRGGGGGGGGGAETVRGRRRRHAGDGVPLPRVQRQLWRAAAALPCAREGSGGAAAAQSPPLQHARACYRRRRVRGAAKPARDAGDGGDVAADRAGVRREPAVAQLRRRRLRVPAADGGGEQLHAPRAAVAGGVLRPAPPLCGGSDPRRRRHRARRAGLPQRQDRLLLVADAAVRHVRGPAAAPLEQDGSSAARARVPGVVPGRHALHQLRQPAPRAAADRDEALQRRSGAALPSRQRPAAAYDGRRRDVPFLLGRVGRPDRLRPRVGRRVDQPLSVPEPRTLGGEEGARPHQHEPQAEGVAAAVLQRGRGRRRRARAPAPHRRGGLGAAARLLGAPILAAARLARRRGGATRAAAALCQRDRARPAGVAEDCAGEEAQRQPVSAASPAARRALPPL